MKTPTQVQQAKNKVAPSIKAGRILLVATSCLFFLFGAWNIVDFFLRIFLEGETDWADPYSIIWTVILPIIGLFMIASGVGGISFVKDKGPFISFTSLAAISSAIVFVIVLLFEIRSLLLRGDIIPINIAYIVQGVVCMAYFLGWMLANNWLD